MNKNGYEELNKKSIEIIKLYEKDVIEYNKNHKKTIELYGSYKERWDAYCQF